MPVYTHSFGIFQDSAVETLAESHNRLVIDATHLSRHWHRCGMTSDFWARYGSLFIPTSTPSGWLSRDSAFHVFTYLLNELFENCAKFSRGGETEVQFDSWMFADHVVYQMSNHIRSSDVPPFVELLQELFSGDVEDLYFSKLEANAESDEGGSGLGYLTLMKDYGVQFGFGFEPVGVDSVRVDVQALVSKKEM